MPAWVLILAGRYDVAFQFSPRDWHVHEMVFGFLPAVITGFLLTALPNWTDRAPIRGIPLLLLVTSMAGRSDDERHSMGSFSFLQQSLTEPFL